MQIFGLVVFIGQKDVDIVIVFVLLDKGHEAENLQKECFYCINMIYENCFATSVCIITMLMEVLGARIYNSIMSLLYSVHEVMCRVTLYC